MPNSQLTDRGIQSLAKTLGWHEKKTHWEYPVFDASGEAIATRCKAFDSSASPKYWWRDGKPEHPYAEWYIPPGTIDAIQAANGVVYIANGEPACVVHHTAQVYNTIATTLSEVSVPKSLLSVLRELGTLRVLYLADKDDAGKKSAALWRDALSGTGIDFEALDWGNVREKYDSNDAWIDCGFNIAAFQAQLGNLKALALPAPEPKPSYATDYDPSDNGDLVRAIENVLSLEGAFTGRVYQQQWKQMRCVHHDDTHASAGFNIESGVINCQACGSHSPYDTADRLGIDKSQYIKRPAPLRKRSKPERPAPIVLPDAPKETRNYTQLIDDEIMALDLAYEYGERISWFPQDDLPISVVSALLNLSSARSSLPAVLVKMHYALRTGTLKPYFTIADVVKATGYSERLISKTLKTLEKMTFIHFLRTVSLDTLPPKESEQKGRPPQLWAIECDSTLIRDCLKNMLERKSATRVVNRAVANPKHVYGLQSALQLSDSDYEAYKQKALTLQREKVNVEADRAYMREMFGNGNDWKGWAHALDIDLAIPLDVSTFDNCKELRARVALWWIQHIRDINSREDWQRILGCSDPTIDSTFDLAHIKSIPQTEKLELEAPNTVKAMETLYQKTQREYRGKIWKISYKITGEEGWQESSEYNYKRQFVNNLGKIEKVFMILTTPSKQVPMDVDEIAASEAETETPDNVLEPDFRDQEQSTENIEVSHYTDTNNNESGTKSKKVTVVNDEHVYTEFPYAWSFRQVQMMVHAYTDYTLHNDGTVMSNDKCLIRKRSDLGEIVRWLIGIAPDKALRTVASYFGEDYSEETEMKELQAIEAVYRFEENYNNRVVPILNMQLAIQVLSGKIEAGALNEQVELTPVIHIVSDERNPYAVEKREYPKPSEAVIQMMIEHWRNTAPTHSENRFRKGA